jgi:predicted permease
VLIQIAVLVVLAIGCVNMANLMLVRSNVRMKELAIRFSLGAGRWRIVRQLLIESLTLAVIGATIGVALAYAGVRLLSTLGAKDLPRGATLHIDGRVLLVTAAVAVATGLLFGSVPVLHLLRQDLNEVFRGKERGGTAARHAVSVRSVLVSAQVSLAFVLLMGAGLLTLTFYRLLAVRPGFTGDGVMTVRVALPEWRYKDDAVKRTFLARVRESVAGLPGIRRVGATTYLPFSNNRNASLIRIVGRPMTSGDLPPVPGWNFVDSGYLPAMGIPVIRGRNIADSDGADAPKVCLIDEFLARKYWPKGDPIGSEIQIGDPTDSKAPKFTIVGVVGSVKVVSLDERNPVGTVYFSNQQMTSPFNFFVIKMQRDDPQLVSAIRQQVSRIDPELAVFDTKTMPQRIGESLVSQRAAMTLCMMFGGLALLLAAVGIYGVLAYSVTQRTREIGIRSAIGAEPRDILGMVIGQGLRVSIAGLVIGAVAAFALTRLMASLLYGVKPADPLVFAGAAVVLGAAALIASAIPSIRAVRIQPSNALRYE